MSSSEPQTNAELVQIFTTVDAMESIRDRIFGTSPELFEYSGSVAHWLYFSTDTLEIGTGEDYVCVYGSSADFLSGTLPEKLYIDPIQLDFNSTSAHVIASSLQPTDAILKLSNSEIKKYLNSTVLFTRCDGGNENNREILFVSNGGYTTMFPDVFEREINAWILSSGYDSGAGTMAESGWYIGMGSEVDLITTVYKDQELVTNSSTDLISMTTTGLIQTSTMPPLIRWGTEPEQIHTFENGETAPTVLLIDFGSFPSIQYKADQADAVFAYKKDDESSIVLGAGQTPMMPNPEKTTCNLTGVVVELQWDDVIII